MQFDESKNVQAVEFNGDDIDDDLHETAALVAAHFAQRAPLADDPTAQLLGLVPDAQRALDSAALRRARSAAKLGVEQLADRLSDRGWSVRPPLVISWESGATSSVPPALIAAIADELRVEVTKLTRRGSAPAESRLDKLRDTPRLQALLTRLARARSISEASAFALLEGSQSSFAFRGAPEDEQYLLILERFVDQLEKDN
ncbi:MAG TPA: hypothetical protein VGM94_02330 [Galbitalea sp.]|jgi:transcriptional regulator with XRE-family HTH domain